MMRKKMIYSVIVSMLSLSAFAQTNTFPSSGNVGIGTTSPQGNLDTYGSGYFGFQDYRTQNVQKVLVLRAEPVSGMYAQSRFNFYTTPGTTVNGVSNLSIKSQYSSDAESGTLFSFKGNGDFYVSGGLGIGTLNPAYKLDVNGIAHINGTIISGVKDYSINSAAFQLTDQSNVDGISGVSPTGAFRWYTNPNNSDRTGFLYQLRSYDATNGESSGLLTIVGDGKIGIGTTTPSEKLSVNGKIRAKEIKVETSNWPDFVFEPSYILPDLKETEQFIKENKHLPEIPSAKEASENGISLGEMNAKLLKKIEELTLYVIDLKKDNDLMKQEINQLKSKP